MMDFTNESLVFLENIQQTGPVKPTAATKVQLANSSRPFLLPNNPRVGSKSLLIKPLKGTQFEVTIDELDSVLNLKRKAMEQLQISNPPKLLYKGKALANQSLLVDFKEFTAPITLVASESTSSQADELIVPVQVKSVSEDPPAKPAVPDDFELKLKALLDNRLKNADSARLALVEIMSILQKYQ